MEKLTPGVLSESRSIKLATFSVGGMFPGCFLARGRKGVEGGAGLQKSAM
jgi:hypothetical protein